MEPSRHLWLWQLTSSVVTLSAQISIFLRQYIILAIQNRLLERRYHYYDLKSGRRCLVIYWYEIRCLWVLSMVWRVAQGRVQNIGWFLYTVMHGLITEMQSEKWIFLRFRCCAIIIDFVVCYHYQVLYTVHEYMCNNFIRLAAQSVCLSIIILWDFHCIQSPSLTETSLSSACR